MIFQFVMRQVPVGFRFSFVKEAKWNTFKSINILFTFQCRTDDRTQHMRENIIRIMENCSKFVSYFDSELSQCGSYDELMKAIGKR